MPFSDPGLVWILIGLIAAWLVLGCLKTIGYGYYNAVLWHNLKIQVHNLRIEQKRRMQELDREVSAGGEDTPESDVIILEPEEAEAIAADDAGPMQARTAA